MGLENPITSISRPSGQRRAQIVKILVGEDLLTEVRGAEFLNRSNTSVQEGPSSCSEWNINGNIKAEKWSGWPVKSRVEGIPYGLQARKAPSWVPFLRLEACVSLLTITGERRKKRPPPSAAVPFAAWVNGPLPGSLTEGRKSRQPSPNQKACIKRRQ